MATPAPAIDNAAPPPAPEAARTKTPQGRRSTVLAAPAIVLAVVVVLRCIPVQTYWNWFRDLRLYVWWPVLALLGALGFPIAGWLRHRRDGLARFYPVTAFGAAAVLSAIPPFLVWSWAADLPAAWCDAALLFGAVYALAITIGFVCYSESWRACSGAVASRVRTALTSGEFDRYLRGGITRLRRPIWGSAHCLELVYGDYRARKQTVLSQLPRTGNPDGIVACVEGGDRLFRYLELRWPGAEAAGTGWRLRRGHVARELAVMRLWAASLTPGIAIQWAPIERNIDEMMSDSQTFPTLNEFLAAVFHLPMTCRAGIVPPEGLIREIVRLYRAIPDEHYIIDEDRFHIRRVALDSWIAVAPMVVPEQVALDIWRSMAGDDLDPPGSPPAAKDPDPTSMWAAVQIAILYRRWCDRINDGDPDWAVDIAERGANAAREVRDWSSRCRDVWPDAVNAAAGQSSWAYRYVWKASSVWVQVAFLVAAAVGSYVYTLKEVVPSMPGNTGGNVVDQVEDRRFGHDYASGELLAMAPAARTLFLAGDKGLFAFDRASRIVTPLASDPFIDVASNRAGDRVFGAAADQSLRYWSGSRLESASVLLAQPVHPFWPGGQRSSANSIVANYLDSRGWTIAMKNKGLARYRCEPFPDGGCRGSRDWILPDGIADVPLQSAIITPAGAWIRTSAAVEFAEMNTLKPQAARHLGQSLNWLDAGADGGWAWGSSSQGPAWLYHPSHAWKGPFFSPKDTGLRSESEIVMTARTASTSWLATSENLFSYDYGRRRLDLALQGVKVRQIEPAGTSAIAAADAGLYELLPGGSVQTLDKGRIESLSVTHGGDLLLYRRTAENTSEIRGRTPKNATLRTIIPGKGWSGPENRAPEAVLAIRAAGDRFLFVSRGGAFFYHPGDHSYTDCSKANFPFENKDGKTTDNEQLLGPFSSVLREPYNVHRLLALAGGNPVQILDNETRWTSLDPQRQTVARQLAASGDHVIGLGWGGQIHSYLPKRADFLLARSEALAKTPPVGNRFIGDFLPGKQGPHIAILHAGATVLYEPATGSLSDTQLPPRLRDATQVRFTPSGGLLYRRAGGGIADASGATRFGYGDLPFPPASTTALAAGRSGSVLVGGPGGDLHSYNWTSGAFTRIAPGPSTPMPVARIQEFDAGTLVSYVNGDTYYSHNGQWCRVDAQHTGGRGKFVFAAGGVGIRKLSDPDVCAPAPEPAARLMREFTRRSVFAWRNGPASVAFFTPEGEVGEVNGTSEEWKQETILSAPRSFLVAGDALYALAGTRLDRVDAKLSLGVLADDLPDNASMRLVDGRVRVAYARDGEIRVRDWTGSAEGRASARGGDRPVALQPSQTRCAAGDSGKIRLVDSRGAWADYDVDTGHWLDHAPPVSGAVFAGCSLDPPAGLRERVRRIFAGARLRVFFRRPDGALLERDPDSAALSPATAPGHWIQDQAFSTPRFRFTPGTPSSFQRKSARGWEDLHPAVNGFAEDHYDDAALAIDGSVWALQSSRVIEFRADGPTLVETGRSLAAPGVSQISGSRVAAALGLVAPETSGVLAVLPFAGGHIRWTKGAGLGLLGEWQEASMAGVPVWGSCGALSPQCIIDLGVGPGGEVAVSTEAGVVIRDSGDLAAVAWHPEWRGVRFLQGDFGRLLFRFDFGVREWNGKGLSPAGAPLESVAQSGPWTWTLRAGEPLQIVHRETSAARGIESSPGGWWFRDDRADFIRREGASLSIETRDGVWEIDAVAGRHGDGDFKRTAAPPADGFPDGSSPDPGGIGKAISITREREWLRFSPLDSPDRPAFQDGRFFFDAAQGIAAASDGVYMLVPQRGVVRRHLDHPNEILDFWRLPPSAEPLVALDTAGNAVRLRGAPRDGRPIVGFTRAAGGGSWQPWNPGRDTAQVAVGPVMWRAESQGSFVPYMLGGEKLPLSDWWSSTRFAWDDIRALGALADDIAVFSTAAGLVVIPLDGGPEALAWSLHSAALDHIATARRNGQSRGLAVWGASGGFLITRSGGRIDMAAVPRPQDLLEVSGLVLSRRESPDGGLIALRERWGRSGQWRPLETELGVPVFAGGQLAIDGSSAAAPLTNAGRTYWWTAAGCYEAGCVVVRNEMVGAELVARDIMRALAPCPFAYLREIASGLVGICADNGTWTAWSLAPGQKTWTGVDPGSVAGAFRLGGGVAFDVQTLTWRQSGDQFPWSSRAFTVDPQAYPLFTSRGEKGDALSFDVVTALSYDEASATLEIGTDGGLFRWPVAAPAPLYLHPGTNGVQFVFDPGALGNQWATGITRLRRDARGRLWASMPGLQQLGRFEPPERWEFQTSANWPTADFAREGWTVTFGGDGLSHGETLWTQSSDAFGLGTAPIEGVIDFDYEPGAVWIATAKHGLFKAFSSRLLSLPAGAAPR